MAATNSTSNLGLPQWDATDKPERTDFNTAFADLDTAVDAVETVADGIVARPFCHVTKSATQSINHNSWTALAFPDEFVDARAMHDPTTNNSRVVAVEAGFYIISALATFAVNDTSVRGLRFRLNGSTIIGQADYNNLGTASDVGMNITAFRNMSLNDYVEVQAFQYSGGALNIQATNCHFVVARIG
jgi:hypothetical protein